MGTHTRAHTHTHLCAGDTLGGHCDDVEADLAQPIVAASIGCDAVRAVHIGLWV